MKKQVFRGWIASCFLVGSLVFAYQSELIYAVIFLLVGLLFLYRAVTERR